VTPTVGSADIAKAPGQAARTRARARAAATCPSSAFCMWSGAEFTGKLWYYSITEWSQNEWHYVGSEANDKAVSLYNNRVHITWVSKNWPPSEGEACIKPGQAYSDLIGKWFEYHPSEAWDSISSFVLSEKQTSCPSGYGFDEIEEARPSSPTGSPSSGDATPGQSSPAGQSPSPGQSPAEGQ